MKTAIIVLRCIGITGAGWFAFRLAVLIVDLCKGGFYGDGPAFSFDTFKTIFLFGALAVLLALPYQKLGQNGAIYCAVALFAAAGSFMMHMFGGFFVAGLASPGAVDFAVWRVMAMFFVFFASQLAVIVFLIKNG